MEIQFTDEANDDLEYIYQFLIDAGVANAAGILRGVIDAADNLLVFPKMGALVLMLKYSDEIRDYYHKNFCLRYLVTNECIFILRVWHQKEKERNDLT